MVWQKSCPSVSFAPIMYWHWYCPWILCCSETTNINIYLNQNCSSLGMFHWNQLFLFLVKENGSGYLDRKSSGPLYLFFCPVSEVEFCLFKSLHATVLCSKHKTAAIFYFPSLIRVWFRKPVSNSVCIRYWWSVYQHCVVFSIPQTWALCALVPLNCCSIGQGFAACPSLGAHFPRGKAQRIGIIQPGQEELQGDLIVAF